MEIPGNSWRWMWDPLPTRHLDGDSDLLWRALPSSFRDYKKRETEGEKKEIALTGANMHQPLSSRFQLRLTNFRYTCRPKEWRPRAAATHVLDGEARQFPSLPPKASAEWNWQSGSQDVPRAIVLRYMRLWFLGGPHGLHTHETYPVTYPRNCR